MDRVRSTWKRVLVMVIGTTALPVTSALAAGPSSGPYVDKRPPAVANWRSEAFIVFPDGEKVVASLRRTPALIGPVTDDFSTEYGTLERLAALGSGDAAYALYGGLRRCETAPASEAELRAALERLRSKRELALRGRAPVTLSESVPLEAVARDALIDPRRFCAGITAQQQQTSGQWLDLAATRGVVWAMRERAQGLPPGPQAIAAWQELWAAGSISALGGLARQFGYLDATFGDHPERVRAVAYAFLSVQLRMAAAAAIPGAVHERKAREIRSAFERHSAQLSAREVDEAMSLAKSILMANDRCCFVD